MMQDRRTSIRRYRAGRFTLIELLVVITIISILASMLLPALNVARRKAKLGRWKAHSRGVQAYPSLVAYYNFEDEDRRIVSGKLAVANQAHGIDIEGYRADLSNGRIYSDATPSGGRWIGKNGLYFGGSANALMECGNAPWLSLPREMSFEAWIMLDRVGSGNTIIAKTYRNDYAKTTYWCDIRGSNKEVWWGGKVGGSNHAVNWKGADFKQGEWYHVAGTDDGQKYHFYVNGEEKASATSNKSRNEGTWTMRVGKRGHMNPFKGFIDEVGLYGRALTPAEVKAHYEMGAP